jgi:hypothetical protein
MWRFVQETTERGWLIGFDQLVTKFFLEIYTSCNCGRMLCLQREGSIHAAILSLYFFPQPPLLPYHELFGHPVIMPISLWV